MIETSRQLPSLFHLGVQRSGSTYLYNLLASHPQITLSRDKEINFYTEHYAKGVQWYQDSFTGDGIKIDTSVKYFMKGDIAAQRLKAHLKGRTPLFLLVMRNPIDYVYSHYLTHLRSGYFKRHRDLYPRIPVDFTTFAELNPDYLYRGRYAHILEKFWLPIFSVDCFHFISFEDFIAHTDDAVRQILKFWRLEDRALKTVSTSKHKLLNYPILYKLSKVLALLPPLKRSMKRSRVINFFYDRYLTSKAQKLTARQRQQLAGYFKSDVERLGQLTGLDYSNWYDFNAATDDSAMESAETGK